MMTILRRILACAFLGIVVLSPPSSAGAAPLSASPGQSGGEGGGSATSVTIRAATKQDPILQTIVGQPHSAPVGNDPPARCLRLAYTDFSGVKDAPTQITGASVRPATPAAPAACIVDGYVASQVAFRVWLPLETWNGKYMGTGCGGRCGALLPGACDFQATRGYACMANDLGHRSTTYDNLWALDNIPAEIDFGFRATHVATLIGKEITRRFYGRDPAHAYFVGASTGGRQALVEVQRFPYDFDGVISGEPAISTPPTQLPPDQRLAGLPGSILFENGKAVLTADQIRMVHAAAIARCDAEDGLKDGIITNPRTCDFHPSDLLCGAATTAQCLDRHQVAVLERLYAIGPQPGSELGWIGAYVAQDNSAGRYIARNTVTADYPYNWVFDNATNPDIRGFKRAGGKLILYQGWADEVIAPMGPVDYYETVERLMGGRAATQDFFRFFIVPGQSHIPGNIGAESLNYVQALEAWVEHTQPPDMLIGHKLAWITQMMGPMYLDGDMIASNWLYSRPIYPYPIEAHYSGTGDPDSAASFRAWDPTTRDWLKPTP